MATFSGGKALLRTDKIFIRSRTVAGSTSSSDPGVLLYSIADDEYAIMRVHAFQTTGASNTRFQIDAYAPQDWIRDTDNNSASTAAKRRVPLLYGQEDIISGGTGDFIENNGKAEEFQIPSGCDLRYKLTFSSIQNDEWCVFWADIDVYSINNTIEVL